MEIRPEKKEDISVITQITEEAFQNHPKSVQNEHRIVIALREKGALFISLVAVVDRQVVGHIAFSKVLVEKQEVGWYGIGPLSVKPEFQGKGIGSALVKEGMLALRDSGANGCILVGDPAYYTRFGFITHPNLTINHVPAENILSFSFDQVVPKGSVDFNSAFFI